MTDGIMSNRKANRAEWQVCVTVVVHKILAVLGGLLLAWLAL